MLVDLIGLTARLVVGAILTTAAVAKLADVAAFENSLQQFFTRRLQHVHALARIVPIAELTIGLAIALGLLLPASIFAAFVLLSGFGLVVIQAWTRGSSFPCRCFGSLVSTSVPGLRALVRIVFLQLIAVIAAVTAWGDSLTLWRRVPSAQVAGLSLAATSLVILTLYLIDSIDPSVARLLLPRSRQLWRRDHEYLHEDKA
jgi:uncharacterized membrane protein YphA (DoxX/SURF4 family)